MCTAPIAFSVHVSGGVGWGGVLYSPLPVTVTLEPGGHLGQMKRTEPGRVATPSMNTEEEHDVAFCSFLLSFCPHSLPRVRLWGACSDLSLHLLFKEGRQDGMVEPRPLQGAERIMGSSVQGTVAGPQLPWLSAGEWIDCSGPRQTRLHGGQDHRGGVSFGDASEQPGRNRR